MQSNQYLPPTAAELVQLLQLLPHPEGGFFLETFRSGSVPMESKGQTNFQVDNAKDLVVTSGRTHCRPDKDDRRNSLTSIYWVPTTKSPIQPLVCNESDHVHYYQGGLPMEYLQYNPVNNTIETAIVGPDIRKGHVLQYPIAGGRWKCAKLLTDYQNTIHADYSIIAEAVGPAFDFYDFHFVSVEELQKQPSDIQHRLHSFLQASLEISEIEEHYDSKQVQECKAKERM